MWWSRSNKVGATPLRSLSALHACGLVGHGMSVPAPSSALPIRLFVAPCTQSNELKVIPRASRGVLARREACPLPAGERPATPRGEDGRAADPGQRPRAPDTTRPSLFATARSAQGRPRPLPSTVSDGGDRWDSLATQCGGHDAPSVARLGWRPPEGGTRSPAGHGPIRHSCADQPPAPQSGMTAVASISTSAPGSRSAATSTSVIAGKWPPKVAR